MTSRWRQQQVRRPSTWRQSLLFNSLLLLLPILAARIVIGAYSGDVATDPLSIEARAETQQEIENKFSALAGPVGSERAFWAERIRQTLNQRDFSAARGYLLAAPMMLNKQDAAAVQAAADAENTGTRDQRLARAALFFLPDDVRETYQRSIAPPPLPEADTEIAAETSEGAAPEPDLDPEPYIETEDGDSVEPLPSAAAETIMDEPFSGQRAFFLLGDPADLTRRSQRWAAGEQVDSLQLRLRALGILTADETDDTAKAIYNAASILRAAYRSGRLSESFADYIDGRVEDALPEALLRTNLQIAFEGVMTTDQRTEEILQTYRATLQPEARDRLSRDMQTIARLAELTSSSGAMTLVEQVRTPEDMRRALLLAEAGGDRTVALAQEIGPDVLRLAQIGAKWTRALILQVMGLMALIMALVWVTLSALTQAETVRVRP